ncbi:MAG: acetate--CoA ligase family protein [Desulfobacterales bacterium]
MELFFNPDSIAVVGASERKLGSLVVQNLLRGYTGRIFPVNPNYKQIHGLNCFPSLDGIPHPVELVIVLVPAQLVPSVIEACARKGIKNVIIESAGFAEVGDNGIALQERCKAIAKQSGIRIWGPNCMGLVDVHSNHFFTFMHPAVEREGLIPGRISLIVQSGMLSAIFLAELRRRGIGISKACSIGNRMDVDECDLLQYLMNDPRTDAIALYLESLPRGRLFAKIAGNSEKPIVLLKGGRSEAGARAAMSHTSSLSGNSRLMDSILKQCGVILANDIYEMMDISNALTMIPDLPSPCRTAIITLSGGAGILACDALERKGLRVAKLSEKTRQDIRKVFPEWMPVSNPIDLFPAVGVHGRSRAFSLTFSSVLEDPNVDVLLIHYVAGLDSEFEELEDLKKKADSVKKVVFFWLMGVEEGTSAFLRKTRKLGIAVHGEIIRITDCLAAAARYKPRRQEAFSREAEMTTEFEKSSGKITAPLYENSVLDEYDSKQLLAAQKIPVAEEMILNHLSEAENVAKKWGFPVVLKGLIAGETHKTEFGLVHLGIFSLSQLEEAFHQIKTKVGDQGRILIQRQIKVDYELITGFLRDEEFGPCVMFGMGGILAELDPDVAFALAPLKKEDAFRLIEQIRGKQLLEGFRGMMPLKKDQMADILVRLGDLGTADPHIAQIDINPLAVSEGSPVAIDANIVLDASVARGKREI